jgi:hypothetical protein
MNPRAGLSEPMLAEATLGGRERGRVTPMPGPAAPACPPVRRCGAPTCTPLGSACRWPLDRRPCPHHKDADPTQRCLARLRPPKGRKRGDRCLAWLLVGSTLCRVHTPELIERRREHAKAQRATEAHQRRVASLRPVRDLFALVLGILDAELERPGGGGATLAHHLGPVRS